MAGWNEIFDRMQDTVIITDVYGYILDFNHPDPLQDIRKGKKIEKYMPCDFCEGEDEYRIKDRLFLRQISSVEEKGHRQGYLIILSDITERAKLLELNIQKNNELKEAADKQERANRELSEYVRQVEALADVSEQLRLARVIHDGMGHAITDLFALSQMGLILKDGGQYESLRLSYPACEGRHASHAAKLDDLLLEGIGICDRALSASDSSVRTDAPLGTRLDNFVQRSLFPVDLNVEGTESEWEKPIKELLWDICVEGYHNVLDHSMADRMSIRLQMNEGEIILEISDNGSFHGTLEKGFGLTSMEERVNALGGEISFKTEQGEGFGITVRWRKI